MFPRWINNALSSRGEVVDLDSVYFGDNERFFISENIPEVFSEINPETTGIGYIFKQAMPISVLEETLETLLGKIFDLQVEAVTESNYKLINDRRNFGKAIQIVKVYLELRKSSLWDTASKVPALVFVLSLLSFFDYENCPNPSVISDCGNRYFSLTNLYEVSIDFPPNFVVTNPNHTFHKGITRFFTGRDNKAIFLRNSISRDLEGVQFILSSRENFQDAVRGKPLSPPVLTEAILLQYEKLRRKF